VRVLEGGLGTGDVSGVSADHAVTADPAQAERIEVLRGPATLLYGSSAIGGVVNVLDERIPTSRATGSLSGSVGLRGGSVSDERSGTVNLDGGGGSWAWHVDGMAREADDYHVPGFARLEEDEHEEDEHEEDEHEEDEPFGTVPNTDLETRGGRVGASYFFGDKGFFGVSVSGFETEYGLPGGLEHGDEEEEHEEDDEDGVPVRIDMQQRRIDLRGEISRPFGVFQALKLRLGGTDYEHVELEGAEPGTFFFNDFLEGRIELVQRRRGRHGGSIGIQYLDRELEAVGAEAFIPKTATRRWAVFTFQEIESGPLRWQLGGRFESQDTDPTSAVFSSRSHDGFSASAGLVWDAGEVWSIGASLARSVKLPAAEELFSEGLHVATQAFEVGNPDLGEETGLGFDLSLRLDGERISGELTLFRQDFDDFIFQAFTGEVEDGFPVVLYSQQDAELVGAELKARVELYESNGHHVHLRLVGDVVDAELDGGGNLPRIPPLRLGGGVHYHSERWNASAEVQWVDDQTDAGENESPTAGYTLVDASLGYRFLFRNQILDLLLRGRNLTDEEARSHTSFLKNVAPLPGRDVSLAMKLLF
jgi:iron complex outermembrane receptor protein